MTGLMRVFSGSCVDLDDQDAVVMPHRVEKKHVLGSGADFFDDQGRPLQPQPRTMNKVFSGSTLDLNAGDPDGDGAAHGSPPGTPRHTGVTLSHVRLGMSEQALTRVPKARINVAVLGGGSYMSPHIVLCALNAGYTVRCALVASAANTTLTEDVLRNIHPDSRSRLQVLSVDLFSSASLQDAIRGCPFVVHCGLQGVPAGRDIIEAQTSAVTALYAAISAIGSERFQRVVITGSASSCFHPSQKPADGKEEFDETTQNTTASRTIDIQQFAKLKFEEEAWRLQKINRVDLTTILPSVMIGPSLTAEVSEAMRTLGELATSQAVIPLVPRVYWNFVDVRDVAQAHVAALESTAAANQRFIVTAYNCSMADMGGLIRTTHPHLHPPIYNAPFLLSLLLGPLYNARVSFVQAWRTLGRRPRLSAKKIERKLGWTITPFEETVRDSVTDLIERGYVPSANAVVDPRTSAGCSWVRWTLVVVGAASVAGYVLKYRKR